MTSQWYFYLLCAFGQDISLLFSCICMSLLQTSFLKYDNSSNSTKQPLHNTRLHSPDLHLEEKLSGMNFDIITTKATVTHWTNIGREELLLSVISQGKPLIRKTNQSLFFKDMVTFGEFETLVNRPRCEVHN